jgi:hypothetical protein
MERENERKRRGTEAAPLLPQYSIPLFLKALLRRY